MVYPVCPLLTEKVSCVSVHAILRKNRQIIKNYLSHSGGMITVRIMNVLNLGEDVRRFVQLMLKFQVCFEISRTIFL